MTTTKRPSAAAHGEVDYTTVTCDSCNTEILHDDAQRFVIGELRDRRDLSASNLTRVDFTQETVATDSVDHIGLEGTVKSRLNEMGVRRYLRPGACSAYSPRRRDAIRETTPMDPRQPADAEEEEEPVALGFLDASWPQPFENSQRMWSYNRPVEIDKPMVAVRWKSIGFYALVGESAITFRERLTKESLCTALERIREQNPVGRILLVADNDSSHHAKPTQQRADEFGVEFVFLPPYSPVLNPIEPLWKSLKRKISPEIFEDEDHFKQFATTTFLDLLKRINFQTIGLRHSCRTFRHCANHSGAWLTAYTAYYNHDQSHQALEN